MKEFRYEAIDTDGRPIHGMLEAEDQDALRELLERRGQKMVSVVSAEITQPHHDLGRPLTRLSQLRITESVRTAFLTRLPVDVALQAAAREPAWSPASALLPWIQGAAAAVLTVAVVHAAVSGAVALPFYVAVTLALLAFGPIWGFASALERRPGQLLRQMSASLQAGTADVAEMAHLLPGNLGEIVRSDLPNDKKLLVISELMSGTSGFDFARHRLFFILLGPVFLLMSALGVCYAFLTLVVPGFRDIFDGFDLDLPWLTQFVVRTSTSAEFLGVPGAIALAAFGILMVTGLFLVMYRGWLNGALLSMPLLGAGPRWINLAGVARWLAALLRNNGAPDESLRIAVRQSHSGIIQQDGQHLADMIRDGRVLSKATTSLSGLPLSLLAGLANEPSDSRRRYAVASTLDSVATMFDRAVFSSGKMLAAFLQLILVIVVSAVAGLVVLGLLLPLIQLLNILS